MTNSYTINIDGIGPVLFEQSSRAKRIIISVRTSKDVRVAVPKRISFKKAEEFAFSKIEWINKHLEKIKRYEKDRITTRHNFSDTDKVTAKGVLIIRLNQLAEKHGFTYNKVSIRNQRTRWGSCSGKSNISLNMNLMLVPQELVDYVMLHELVHTRIHNHSKKFWAELDKYTENSKVMAKRLRMHDLKLS
ncbi:M48 family metallopeptidase [Chloroflexota bacterium]